VTEKLTTLQAWALAKYGDHAPNMDTLRRWAREGKIYPAPQKQGRAYFLTENAQYVDDYNNSDFMRKVRGSTQTQ
jgi:hypothetical protein